MLVALKATFLSLATLYDSDGASASSCRRDDKLSFHWNFSPGIHTVTRQMGAGGGRWQWYSWFWTVLSSRCLPAPALGFVPHRTTRSTEISGHEGGGDCNVEMVWGGIQGICWSLEGRRGHTLVTKRGMVVCIYQPTFSTQL